MKYKLDYSDYQFENLNISLLRSFEKLTKEACSYVVSLPINEQCDFVKNTNDCESDSIFVNCLEAIFCQPIPARYFSIFLMLLMVPILFFILGIMTDEFFCPALANLSELLRLSESLAGVTILAFGNGAPDLLTNLAAPVQINIRFLYSQLLGNGVYLTTVCAGIIMIISPFRLIPRAYMRDCFFFIGSIVWLSYMFNDLKVSFYEPIVLMGLYIVFLVSIIIFEKFLIKEHKESVVGDSVKYGDVEPMIDDKGVTMLVPKVLKRKSSFLITPDVVADSKRKKALEEIGKEKLSKEERSQKIFESNLGLFKDFIRYMTPVHKEDWNSGTFGFKMFAIVKAPILIFFKLIIPVVNYTEYNHHWCKLARCLNFILLALIILSAFNLFSIDLGIVIPLWSLILLIAFLTSMIVFFTSEVKSPPKYHKVFIFVGFFASMLHIYIIANEIVEILMALGVFLQISSGTLGLSILTWGNAIGDITSNVIIARSGYPRMAFSACYGGPMFNLLVGLGLIFTRYLIVKHSWEIPVVAGKFAPNCNAFILMSICSSLFFISLFRFQGRKFFGFYLINLYLIFLIFSFLCEFYVIHPLGVSYKIEGEAIVG